jgi:Fic family protein
LYSPKFSYNNIILSNISRIEFSRGIITQASINPENDSTLKKEALIRSVYASTTIGGNILSVEDVNKLINDLDTDYNENEINEAINYSNVLMNLDKYHDNGKITEELILDMHREITKDVVDDILSTGRYRDVGVTVKNLQTNNIRFTPPSNTNVSRLMEDLINWINNSNELSPIIVSGIVHYEFVRIHPFMDGNGRTARALVNLILLIKGYNIKNYIILDEYYNTDINSYLNALKTADDRFDLTLWLEYFTTGFLKSISTVKEEIMNFPTIQQPNDRNKQLILKENQIKIINFLQEFGQITNKETKKLLKISSQASHNNLKKLQKMKIIKRKGSGRSTFYVLV